MDGILEASFRGVPLLVPSESTTEGPKTATHEFVNSDRRFVENLGRFPSKYALTAIVHGQDAIAKRDRLRAALNQPGPGILVHPVYGRVEVAVEGQYEISSSDQNLGEFRFNITFAQTDAAIFPRPVQSQAASVAAKERAARSAAEAAIEGQWNAPRTPISVGDAAAKIAAFADAVSQAFSGITGDLSDILGAASSLRASASSLVLSGSSLAAAIRGVFDAIADLDGDAHATYRATTPLFRFGDDDQPIRNDFGLSLDQTERALNRDTLNTAIRCQSVAAGYAAAVIADYQTTTDLDGAQTNLDASARELVRDLRSVGAAFDAASLLGVRFDPSLTADLIRATQETRATANRVFEDKAAKAFRVSELRRDLTSARLLAYALYESEENVAAIEALNVAQRPSLLSGDLKVLTR